jgi:hypothetical protein
LRIPRGRTGRVNPNGQRPDPDSNPEFDRFRNLTDRLLRVPKKEIKEQEAKEKKKAG